MRVHENIKDNSEAEKIFVICFHKKHFFATYYLLLFTIFLHNLDLQHKHMLELRPCQRC